MELDHTGLTDYIRLADITDPTTHAHGAALLETAKDTGHIQDWTPSIAAAAPFRPPSRTLTDAHLYDVTLADGTTRPVLGSLVVTFAQGLAAGDTHADATALAGRNRQGMP